MRLALYISPGSFPGNNLLCALLILKRKGDHVVISLFLFTR